MQMTVIQCRQSRFGKTIFPFVVGLFGLGLLVGLIPSNAFVWLLWALLVPFSVVYSPDFTVHDEGITFHFPWVDRFNAWDDIRYVMKTGMDMRIYADKLTIFNRFFSYFNFFRFGKQSVYIPALSRENFEDATAAIRARMGDRFHESRY